MTKQAILVAGGAGYIGSHVCKMLAGAGYLPVTLDDLRTGHADAVQWGPLVQASISDNATVQRTLAEHAIKAVIDLAGSIEVAESVRDPLKYYENNLSAKLGFPQTLKDGGVKAIVFSSTAAVYGEPQMVPIPETHPLAPKNPYGRTKLMFEQLLADFHQAGGPAWMALRYFNAAGASFDGEIGERHEPESHLIPLACMARLGTGPALNIFGDDYPTPDGTAIRDYIHVLDLAQAHVLAVEALLKGAPSAVYNLGNGIGTSIKDILAAFAALGLAVPHRFAPRRAGDPSRLVADPSAAKQALGWTPKHTDISTIIQSAFRWHESRITPKMAG